MLFKNSILTVATFFACSIIVFNSCKKNDDISSTGSPGNESAVSTVNTNPSPTINSFTITSKDGNIIGVNGTKPVVNPKTGQMQAASCGSVSSLVVRAVSGVALSNGTIGCVLSTG